MNATQLTTSISAGASPVALGRTLLRRTAHFIDSEQEAMAKLYELIDGLARSDLAALDSVWANEWVFSGADGSLSNKEQAMESIKTGVLVYQPQKYENTLIHVYGRTAVIVGIFTIKGSLQGQDISGRYRSTDVLIKREGRWWVVAEQNTLMR